MVTQGDSRFTTILKSPIFQKLPPFVTRTPFPPEVEADPAERWPWSRELRGWYRCCRSNLWASPSHADAVTVGEQRLHCQCRSPIDRHQCHLCGTALNSPDYGAVSTYPSTTGELAIRADGSTVDRNPRRAMPSADRRITMLVVTTHGLKFSSPLG
ncbi:hypothetical protein BV22DRAFT_395951 [Leucogyrophana mollusca]|uniref:Uncharacterized protein n=1 Tax=Leucogyrophana mollusca TaxID=85980 RepID=A0ACB8BM38_9AGAM|nr:hypothetical protein BV22DRAFT_395951 [Leucogyrophana mollusca]